MSLSRCVHIVSNYGKGESRLVELDRCSQILFGKKQADRSWPGKAKFGM